MASRQYAQREWKLLSWWLATFHMHARIMMNVRLGPPSVFAGAFQDDPLAGRVSQVRSRWADAVFIEGNQLNLVEAKIEPDPGVFSQLVHYARKLRSDPAWSEYASWPLNLIAVIYHDDPSVRVEAPAYGVEWIVYQPNLAELPAAKVGLPDIGGAALPLPHDFLQRLQSWGVVALASNQS